MHAVCYKALFLNLLSSVSSHSNHTLCLQNSNARRAGIALVRAATCRRACQNIIKKSLAHAKVKGLANEYLYMNYASQYQYIVPRYGAKHDARLAEVARKYDPDGVFQGLEPG